MPEYSASRPAPVSAPLLLRARRNTDLLRFAFLGRVETTRRTIFFSPFFSPCVCRSMGEGARHGCFGSISRAYVRRPCFSFWAFLISYIFFCFLGFSMLQARADANGQASVFNEPSEYEWSVAGRESTINMDRVTLATALANQDADYPEIDAIDAGSGSGEDEVAVDPLRSSGAGGWYTLMMLYFAKSEVGGAGVAADAFTPAALKQMCEIENVVFGHPDYGKVCFNSTNTATSMYTSANGTSCTLIRTRTQVSTRVLSSTRVFSPRAAGSLPFLSATSLFYTLWDDSVHPIADVRSALAQVRAAMTIINAASADFGATAPTRATWWATNGARTTAVKDAVVAARTAALPLDPGLGATWTSLMNGIDAMATQLALNSGFAVMGSVNETAVSGNPTTYALLASVEAALGYVGNMDDTVIHQLILFGGMPFDGLLPNSPIKGTDEIVTPGAHTRRCDLLDAQYVAARAAQIFRLAHSSSALQNSLGFFLSSSSLVDNRTVATRSVIDFGSPREPPYETEDDLRAWQKGLEGALLAYFDMQAGFLYSPYRAPATTANLEVKFSQAIWTNIDEFDTIVSSDLTMVGGSLLFVYLYIWFHTGAFPIACFAMLQIMLSVPLALFVYGLTPCRAFFGQVHILAIFISLGIGADDVFVFMDAWRQSSTIPSMKTLEDRMIYTYERAFVSVLTTSATTTIAFLSMGSASIMPIASFGVFAAFTIFFLWVLTVTWWPCAVLMWELYFCRARGMGCCFSCCGCETPVCYIKDQTTQPKFDPQGARTSVTGKEQPAPTEAPKEAAAEDETQVLSLSERVFHDMYAPMLNYSYGPTGPADLKFKPVSAFLVLLFGGLAAYLSSEALTLTTPDEAPTWFPNDHMATGLADLTRDTYLAGEDDQYMTGSLYFGIGGVYAPDFSKWKPDDNRGTVSFDPAFNLSSAEAQSAFIALCDALEVEDCIEVGGTAPLPVCMRDPYNLLSVGTLECFLRDFQTDRRAEGLELPTGPAFDGELTAWLRSGNTRHRSNVGFVNGTVQFARMHFRYSAQVGIPVAPMRSLYDRSVHFLTQRASNPNLAPPASLGDPFFHAGRLSWMETSEELVSVVVNGIILILPCAWVIMFLFTGSVLAATWATITVALITGSLLGGVKVAFKFSLGIGEAIAGCMVGGLSVDYTLHLSHAFMHSSKPDRDGKVLDAATTMGVTVLAGSITTFGSALFMLPCQLTFFSKMCTLIGGTIGFSIIYALFFFMPAMALFGPWGESRSLVGHIMHCARPSQAAATKPADATSSVA